MKYKFERVIDGLSTFLDSELFPGMNDIQEIMARVAVGRVIENTDAIKTALANNGIVRSFGIIDSDGMVDLDLLTKDIKREVEKKGKMVISIPLFGKITIKPNDIDALYNHIIGG